MTKDRDPLALPEMNNTNMATEASPGQGRQMAGVGQASRHMVDATRTGRNPNGNSDGKRSQGETPGTGTRYSAMLVERPNISNRRNLGPERAPSELGSASIPIVTSADRRVNRIGG